MANEFDPATILGPDGAIARRLKEYESRPQQVVMAKAVTQAIVDGHHLMVEAGTGVGKSFAYLVPAIQAAVERKKKIVVSTHTINLQEQLLSKDIPFLRSILPLEFSAALVKGRANYVSLRRLRAAVSRSGTSFDRVESQHELREIVRWASETEDGSRSDLEFRPAPEVWEAVGSDYGNCLGKRCRTYRDCFYYRSVRRARNANLLIVNHALYFTDLALRAAGGTGILPDHDVVILDEAHTLEDAAAAHLGLRVASGAIANLLGRLFNERTTKGLLVFHRLVEAQQQVRRTLIATDTFFDAAAEWVTRQSDSTRPMRRALGLTGLPETLTEELLKLGSQIRGGAESVSDEEQRMELDAAADRCDSQAAALRTWLNRESPDSVYWVEVEPRRTRRVTLACSPIDVGPVLRRDLYERVPTCILTSATLAVGSPPSFAFAKSRLGLMKCETLQLGSPFDFANQVTIHLPRDLPDPSAANAAFEERAIETIRYYLAKTHGKALVLFTSHRMLAEAARSLAPWLAKHNITLYSQSDGLPRSKMVAAFKADIDSVIFGTESFWQGVDVPGETLSNVIITRLPFSVPDHPLLEARLEEIQRRGGNRFLEYQVPEAIIKLKQGFGRLIRSRTDRGLVAILDPRLLTKTYGRQFLDSLPDCPRVIDELGTTP